MLSDLLYSLRDIEFLFNLFGYISFRSGLILGYIIFNSLNINASLD